MLSFARLLLIAFTSVATGFAAENPHAILPETGWPVQTGGAVLSSPCLADLDGDRRLEVIVGSYDSHVYVLNAKGESSFARAWKTGGPVVASPSVGDLRGDGNLCVVVGSRDGSVYAWDHQGQSVPGWPRQTGGPVFSSAALGYLENDSQLSIVVGNENGVLHAFRSDGTPLPGWPVDLGDPVHASPAIADLDRDGQKEVIVTGEGELLHVLTPGGKPAPGWPRPAGKYNRGSPSVGDLDNDGKLEVVVHGKDYHLYAYRYDGTPYGDQAAWKPGQRGDSSPALADVDGDGALDVGILTTVAPETATVSFYTSSGEALTGFPVQLQEKLAGDLLTSSLAVGDIDGDNQLDALVGIGRRIHAWRLGKSTNVRDNSGVRKAGDAVEGFPIELGGDIHSSPALGDLDRDGQLELVVGAADGRIYCFDLGVATFNPDSLPWPMFRGNRMRTGVAVPTSLDSGNLLARRMESVLADNKPSTEGLRILSSETFEARVHAGTGSLVSLRSRDLGGADLIQAPPGLVVYFWDKMTDRLAVLSRCVSVREEQGERNTRRISCELAPVDGMASLARANVTYEIVEDDRLSIAVDLESGVSSDYPVELGVALGMDTTSWVRQLYGNGQGVSSYLAQKRVVARYYDFERDMTTGGSQSPQFLAFPPGHHGTSADEARPVLSSPVFGTNMPMSVFESADAFLLWGYRDLNTYAFFTPNHLVPGIGFTVTPRLVKRGETFTFDFFVKPFAKPETSLTEVGYYYSRRIYSTNDLSRDFVGLPEDYHEHRPMPFGNVSFHVGPAHFVGQRNAVDWGITEKKLADFEERRRKTYFTNLWWSGGRDWAELYPTSGTWIDEFGFKTTAKELHAEIARLQNAGLKPFRYFRQIYNVCFRDRPVYVDWCMPNRHGWPFNYTYGARGDLLRTDPSLTVEQRWLHGVEPENVWGPWNVHIDFCNVDFLDWYIKSCQAWLDTFKPPGVSWDMGWDTHVSPCTANSEDAPVRRMVGGGAHGGAQHGLLRAMADVFLWAKKKHPEMHFFMNGSQNSPIMRYVSCVLFEGGWTASKEGIDICKFYGTPITNLAYSGQYSSLDAAREAAMRMMSYGVTHANLHLTSPEREMTEFYYFSALANSVPLVWEDESIVFEWTPAEVEENRKAELLNMQREYPGPAPRHTPPPGRLVTGSVWASADAVLLAIYNARERDVLVRATVSEKLLQRYGWTGSRPVKFTVLGADGFPVETNNFRKNGVSVTGTLRPGQLVLGMGARK